MKQQRIKKRRLVATLLDQNPHAQKIPQPLTCPPVKLEKSTKVNPEGQSSKKKRVISLKDVFQPLFDAEAQRGDQDSDQDTSYIKKNKKRQLLKLFLANMKTETDPKKSKKKEKLSMKSSEFPLITKLLREHVSSLTVEEEVLRKEGMDLKESLTVPFACLDACCQYTVEVKFSNLETLRNDYRKKIHQTMTTHFAKKHSSSSAQQQFTSKPYRKWYRTWQLLLTTKEFCFSKETMKVSSLLEVAEQELKKACLQQHCILHEEDSIMCRSIYKCNRQTLDFLEKMLLYKFHNAEQNFLETPLSGDIRDNANGLFDLDKYYARVDQISVEAKKTVKAIFKKYEHDTTLLPLKFREFYSSEILQQFSHGNNFANKLRIFFDQQCSERIQMQQSHNGRKSNTLETRRTRNTKQEKKITMDSSLCFMKLFSKEWQIVEENALKTLELHLGKEKAKTRFPHLSKYAKTLLAYWNNEDHTVAKRFSVLLENVDV